MIILETERVRLRTFTVEDAPFMLELLNTEGWLKYIGDKNIRTVEEARNYLQNSLLQLYERLGYGFWLAELKADDTPIGMCGLIKRDALEHTDIGFAFLPEYAGKGYAFESAKATLDYALKILTLPAICAIVQENNVRSIKLLEKLGLRYMALIDINEESLCLFCTV